MAFIYPFRGFRYNKDIAGDLNQVIAQPYDKTTPPMQDEYYRRSPFNVVRITLNIEKRKNPDTEYPEAGAVFRQWIRQRVLEQDSLPAIYAYHQEYAVEGSRKLQKGFVALLDLKNPGAGIIPHEQTLAAPKQDRLQLIRSIEGNEDLIYMLYSDDLLTVNGAMDKSISGRAPEIDVSDEYGARHRLWAITDSVVIQNIQNHMKPRELFIADGHHRFETSVNYVKECEQRHWRPSATESFDKRMVAFINIADGVTILPTHRLVRDLPSFDVRSFLNDAKEHFSVETVPSAKELQRKMKEEQDGHVFGFYPAGLKQFYLLRLTEKPQGDADELQRLDVSILHTLLLEKCLGIDEHHLEAQAHVDYEREPEACIRLVDEKKYQAAFFQNPPTAEQMQRIASLGRRMPQKSTDFYPKLLTGLIFMKMEIEKK
ncbi:MAG: DUF1015 domain-containing protein [Acidobacteria bacterium]|nr:DUF1015 domain-containing protein [Acidobacteriota bacterium]